MKLEEKPISMRELLNEVVNTVQPLARKKNLDVVNAVGADVPSTIQGDYGRLRQVILNLVGNAVKFTQKGFVNIRCIRVDKGLQISVQASGIGMSQETLSQIFSPFVQGDSSMTKKFEGTGLGLSICRKLIKAMGGRKFVSSEVGKGSEFTLFLPSS